MRNLKRFVFALVLTAAALSLTSVPDTAHADVWCPRGTMYCECQGYVGCAFDCFAACDL